MTLRTPDHEEPWWNLSRINVGYANRWERLNGVSAVLGLDYGFELLLRALDSILFLLQLAERIRAFVQFTRAGVEFTHQ